MKKIFLTVTAAMLLFSCNNEDNSVTETPEASVTAHRGCASDEVLQWQLKEDPGLAQRRH